MNESDFIRQQLATQRAHLREILEAARRSTDAVAEARPVTTYVEWLTQRLREQLRAHQRALEVADGAQGAPEPRHLLEQLEALDAQAARSLRTVHWRQAAQLSADSILEERQLYAAARLALGLE